MRAVSVIVALLCGGFTADAQVSSRQILYTAADPTGVACGSTQITLRTSTGALFTCQSGVYAAVPGGSASSVAFGGVTAGTNAAALHVGTGGTLDATGSGTIAATSVPASGVTAGTLAAGAYVVPTGGSVDVSGSGTNNATSLGGVGAASIPTKAAPGLVVITTSSNCANGASPAACGAAPVGAVAIPTGITTVALTVNTTAVTANSRIKLQADDTVTIGGVTCNNTLATLVGGLAITARTAGTSFEITYNGTIATNPLCVSYVIIN